MSLIFTRTTCHAARCDKSRTALVSTLCASMLSVTLLSPAVAGDARSIALGGSVIANGHGVHGALENPASMMSMKRRSETVHLRFSGSIEIRDTGSAIDTIRDDDNQNLISDIEVEIDQLSNSQVQCNPIDGSATDVCVDGTQSLADLSTRLLNVLDVVDGETLDAQASSDLGLALTHLRIPIAVHLKATATGAGRPDIAEGDRDYIQEFENLLDNDTLTLGEVSNSQFLAVNSFGIPLGVQQPEDVLRSEGTGSALLRTQLGISFAATFKAGTREIDAGITPKFSSLRAYSVTANVVDEFTDGSTSIADRFDDSEITESSFTFDVGGSMALSNKPIRVAAVLRNVVPESIESEEGFEFETTPQLIVGALYQRGRISVTADAALNSAKVDNFETQKIGVGLEFGTRNLAVRAGLNHDMERPSDNTALSLGFGLGPLQFGARLASSESLEAGLQLSYSFK